MSNSAPNEPVIRAWARLVKAQHRVLGAVEADLKKGGFPPLSWYDVLLELRRARPAGLRPLDLEGRLLLQQHNVSRLLARLEGAGLIVRRPSPEDGRSHTVSITEAGQALLKAMWPSYRSAIQRHVGAKLASDAEASRLGDLLGKLIDAGPD